jgi:hypothetical protein
MRLAYAGSCGFANSHSTVRSPYESDTAIRRSTVDIGSISLSMGVLSSK